MAIYRALIGCFQGALPMREQPEKPIFGPETQKLDPPERPKIKPWRSVVKAVSWRVVGTIDTLILSYLLITFLGPIFGAPVAQGDALETASYIAITEVATKFTLYFLHERAWSLTGWGIEFRNNKHRETLRRTTVKAGLWRIDRLPGHVRSGMVFYRQRCDSGFDWRVRNLHETNTLFLPRADMGSTTVRAGAPPNKPVGQSLSNIYASQPSIGRK